MSDYFETTTIFLFDVHTSLQPLLSQNVPQGLRFLVKADLYRQAYQSGQKISTKNLEIGPLHPTTIKRHLFWAGYASTLSGAAPDHWALQMPFVCWPRGAPVSLQSAQGLKAKVGASACLFSLGWSANLELSFGVNEKVSPESLVQLAAAFRSGDKVFRIDGRESSLTDVFRWFAHRITSECFQGFQNANDMIRVPRYMVIALADYSGPAQLYRPASDTGMPPSTRALMHSMLLGRNVDPVEVIRAENKEIGSQGFLLTALRYLDFGITYFDQGTLLALQNPLRSTRAREAFLCFTSNIKNFLMMVNVWLAFQSEIQRLQPGQGSTDLGLINPDTQLRDMKQRYRTQFTEAFYGAHSKLKGYPD
jgi:hypothetical protein